MPPPGFDPKTASPDDWANYHDTQTEEQKQAGRFRWIATVVSVLSRLYDGREARAAASTFGWEHRLMIHAAFDAGKSRDDIVLELAGRFEAERAPAKQ